MAMQRLEEVLALAGEGLSGDRYAAAEIRKSPGAQLTLIENEHIEAYAREYGVAFTPDQPRRNVVTQGIALNELMGRRFSVGAVLLEGFELCEPCALFASRTQREILKFFPGKGGLRARIVRGGIIRIGDAVRWDGLSVRSETR
jgi:MOSC domain-containing protein YiiM